MNRILWNRRPTGIADDGDIDEMVVHDASIHIEQMGDRCWWIGIDLPDGGYWAGNFHATSRGKMTFSLQESFNGFTWDIDASHEDSP